MYELYSSPARGSKFRKPLVKRVNAVAKEHRNCSQDTNADTGQMAVRGAASDRYIFPARNIGYYFVLHSQNQILDLFAACLNGIFVQPVLEVVR